MSTNRNTIQARDAQIIAGIGKRLQSVQTLVLLGTAYTPAQLTALFQSQINSAKSIAALRSQLSDALQSDVALAKQISTLVKALKAYVMNAFGNTSEAFGDFGFAPEKVPGAKTPLVKVVAAAKLRATREARGTTGKREKEQTKGTAPTSVSISVNSAGKPVGAVAVGNAVGAAVSSSAPARPAPAQ
jgi:hypothetical protein